ncbi:replication protein A 70 kDa DNA-binding subunit A-like isoform X2 [Bidens hawaiensis]
MSAYHVTNHPHRLFLTFDSTVTKCNEEVGSLYGLTLADFDVLRNNGVLPDSVIDLIGYVYTYFDMYDYKTQAGKIKKKMNLQVRDLESRSIFVTLWESYAEQLNTFMVNKREDDTAVIILQFGKYTFSGGRAYVSSCFQGSNLFINDNIEELISFRSSLTGNEGHQSISTRRLVSSELPCSLENDFLTNSVFNTIADVNKKAEVKSVVVTGTIISFMPGVDWYYNACKTCNKKVKTVYVSDPVDASDKVEPKQMIKCPNDACNKRSVSTIPRLYVDS